jgi:hypothetical protein
MSVEVTAKQLVDCTGNASVVGMIGLRRLREKTTQPGTLMYGLAGYEADSLDMNALQAKAAAAVKAGALKLTDFNGNIAGFLHSGGGNAMHVPDADSSTSEAHTATNIRGRQSVLRVMRFLKKQPEFAALHIERMQAETGVRETFRIVGETTVTVDDYTRGRVFEDAVAYSFYPIDLHVEHGVKPEHLKEGVVPTIPLGALIPKGSKNLMVAGRCLSGDRLANSALRVQASCMAMGQAAGAAVALAASAGTTPLRVSLKELRRALAKHGAIVPVVDGVGAGGSPPPHDPDDEHSAAARRRRSQLCLHRSRTGMPTSVPQEHGRTGLGNPFYAPGHGMRFSSYFRATGWLAW